MARLQSQDFAAERERFVETLLAMQVERPLERGACLGRTRGGPAVTARGNSMMHLERLHAVR